MRDRVIFYEQNVETLRNLENCVGVAIIRTMVRSQWIDEVTRRRSRGERGMD